MDLVSFAAGQLLIPQSSKPALMDLDQQEIRVALYDKVSFVQLQEL